MEEGSDQRNGQRGARRWLSTLRYRGPTQTLPRESSRRGIARGNIRRQCGKEIRIRELHIVVPFDLSEADQIEQIQTKFTPSTGQDLDNMPYNPTARMGDQINQSVSNSLRSLRPETKYISRQVYLDALLLHSPMPTIEETLEVWCFLEAFARTGRAKQLGISNVDLPTLKAIWDNAKIKPSIVQNRFHAKTGYDVQLRAFCETAHITYQAFWTLTGNPELLSAKPVVDLAQAAEIRRPVALYALVMDLDILVLNGTTSPEHMREDLNGMQIVGKWADKNREGWKRVSEAFRETIGDKPLSHKDHRFRGLVRRERERAILKDPDVKEVKNMSS